jgi:hypothetical protein
MKNLLCFAVLSSLASAGCSSSDGDGGGPDGASAVPDLRAPADAAGHDLAAARDAATAMPDLPPPLPDLAGLDAGPCATFSDDFSGNQLDPCWQILNGPNGNPLIDISVTGGALHLQAIPGQSGVWFQGSTESLVYKEVTADHFKVTTTARPRKRTDPNAAPTHALHVGGIMVRDPASHGGATENYLFIMVGSNEGASPGVEVKSTVNGASTWAEPAWNNPTAAELRICRLGTDFYLYKRIPGAMTWILANETDQMAPVARPDLPQTVQLGLALNFSGPDNDLDVGFDDVVLAPQAPASVADCIAD